MYMRTVEIDDEVFEYVQKHAEPLVDDFNSALKKLLGLLNSNKINKKEITHKENIVLLNSSVTPQALSQILEVVHLVTKKGYTRNEATNLVARRLKVEKQTILDKYCRQMGLKAREFDLLLTEPKLSRLRQKLYSKFPEHKTTIDELLN